MWKRVGLYGCATLLMAGCATTPVRAPEISEALKAELIREAESTWKSPAHKPLVMPKPDEGIRYIQTCLRLMGYRPGPPNGTVSPQMLEAVKAYIANRFGVQTFNQLAEGEFKKAFDTDCQIESHGLQSLPTQHR